MTITLTGTNDVPVINHATADAVGGVTERADGSPTENTAPPLTDSGTIAFTDVDLTNTHTVSDVLVSAIDSATGLPTAERGTFTPSITNVSTGDGAGVITWDYTVAAGALDDLAEGQTITQTYTVTVKDSSNTTDTQTVTITLTGTNDVPVINHATADAVGGVTERADGSPTENTAPPLTDSGTIAFTDVDLTNTHTVSDVLVSAIDSATGLPTAERGTFTPSITNVSTGDGAGVITWDYTVAAGALDDLAEGQTITQTYTVTVKDSSNTTDTQTVTITLTGTNDVPVINARDGGCRRRGDGAGRRVADREHGASFDRLGHDCVHGCRPDQHPYGVGCPGVGDRLGDRLADGGARHVHAVDHQCVDRRRRRRHHLGLYGCGGRVDDLAEGQTITQTYTVTVKDSSNTTDTQTVTITLTGTNDKPTATADIASPTVVETGIGVPTSAEATGTIADNINDVDAGGTAALLVTQGSSATLSIAQAALSFNPTTHEAEDRRQIRVTVHQGGRDVPL